MAALSDGIVLDLKRVRETKPTTAQRQRLIEKADEVLKAGPFSVVHKTALPPSGDPHDYMSVGPYWWPDPGKPDGLPYIRRDGRINPEFHGDRYDHTRLSDFARATKHLALAWAISGERRYGDRAALLLRTWFLDPATRMNPHLEFGQAIPGHCTGRGIGIIDTQQLIPLLDAIELLLAGGILSSADGVGLRSWFRAYLDWLASSDHGRTERDEHNNHGTWCDAQIAAFALFAGRPDLAHQVIAEVPSRRIDRHIEPDGRQPHELARTRSLSYSCYNLAGLFTLAWTGRHVGIDLWNYASADGRSLRRAVDWLLPYADPARPWPYEQIDETGRPALLPIFAQAAIAWREPRYAAAAERVVPLSGDVTVAICWPMSGVSGAA